MQNKISKYTYFTKSQKIIKRFKRIFDNKGRCLTKPMENKRKYMLLHNHYGYTYYIYIALIFEKKN